MKKVKEMEPNSNVCSENDLLAERSFMSELDKPSIANGYHLEWTEKTVKHVLPSQESQPKVHVCVFGKLF